MVVLQIDPFPSNEDLNRLWTEAWGTTEAKDFSRVLSRSLGHIGAYADGRLVGFLNLAWDGGVHAFILDTCVVPDMRRQGVASRMLLEATKLARERGATWLHVDFQAHLTPLYRGCGFRRTEAGLMELR